MKGLLNYAKTLRDWFIAFKGNAEQLLTVTNLYETFHNTPDNYATLSLGVIAFAYYLKNDNLTEFDGTDPEEFVVIDKLAYDLVYKADSKEKRDDILRRAYNNWYNNCKDDKLGSVLVIFSALVEVLMEEGYKRV